MSLSGVPPYERRCTYLAFPHNGCLVDVTDGGCDLLHPICGIESGFRYNNFFAESQTATTWHVTYDFFSTQLAPQFLYISRLNINPDLLANFTSPVAFFAPFTLQGVQGDDFFECFDALAPARYWRVRFVLGAGTRVAFSKIMFGELFDFGQEPSTNLTEKREQLERGVWSSTSNIKLHRRNGRPRYDYALEYKGLPDSKVKEFYDKVILRRNRFCVLADLDNRTLFNNHGLINGTISDVSSELEGQDFNTLSFDFKEML